MPPGTDSVIRLEACRRSGAEIRPLGGVVPGRDIARRGEDFRPGNSMIAAGAPLRPWDLAALVANDIRRVRVLRRLRVALLSSGDELVAPGSSAAPGAVRDTTKPLLLGLLAELGIPSVDLGLVPDREGAIRRAVRRGLAECEVLVTTGGSSVGERDVVPCAVRRIPGARVIARRIRLRPGSTTGVVVVRRQPIFLLSGPPVAALSGFLAVVEPYLRAVAGSGVRDRATVVALLDHKIAHSRGVREMVRVRLVLRRGVRRAIVLERHGASRLSTLTEADGLLILEEGRGSYRKGEPVPVMRL